MPCASAPGSLEGKSTVSFLRRFYQEEQSRPAAYVSKCRDDCSGVHSNDGEIKQTPSQDAKDVESMPCASAPGSLEGKPTLSFLRRFYQKEQSRPAAYASKCRDDCSGVHSNDAEAKERTCQNAKSVESMRYASAPGVKFSPLQVQSATRKVLLPQNVASDKATHPNFAPEGEASLGLSDISVERALPFKKQSRFPGFGT